MPIIKEGSERTLSIIKKRSQRLDMVEVAGDMVNFGASIVLKALQGAIDGGDLGKIQEIRGDIRKEIRDYVLADIAKTAKKETEKHAPKPKQKTKEKPKMFSVKKEAESYKEELIKLGNPEEAAKLAEDGVYLGVSMMLGVVARMAEKGDAEEGREALKKIRDEATDYMMSKIKAAL